MTYSLNHKRRVVLIDALRATSARWYNGAVSEYDRQFSYGICRGVQAELGWPKDPRFYGYQLVADGLEDIGYGRDIYPFRDFVAEGDWEVRALFCLLFADILEAQDACD